MAPDGDSTKTNGNGREPILRRWTDKLLCAFALMILGLVSIVYASVCKDMDQFDAIQRSNVERIVKVEQHQADIRDDLSEIKGNQTEMQRILNRIAVGMKLEK